MSPSVSYLEDLYQDLADPEYALGLLNLCLKDEDYQSFLAILNDVANVRGGIGALSRKANLNREHVFRMLSKNGNPTLDSLRHLLKAMGLKLVLENA